MRENEEKISAVKKLFKVSQCQLKTKMQNNTPEIIDKVNNACLPANIDADKMLQKVIQLLKTSKNFELTSNMA